MNKNQITLLLLCIVVFLSTIFVGCKKNLEPVPDITPNTKSSPYDHNIRELAEMHNKAFQELLEAYDYQAEDWQQALLSSINNISFLNEEEKETLIRNIENNGWLSLNSGDELVEKLNNDALESIGNCNFEHHDIVVKYIDQCTELTNNIINYEQFVADVELVVENARRELDEQEFIAVQSVAYVLESTSYLWLPREIGGSGVALSFILSINPDFNYGALSKGKPMPEWLKNGLIADGKAAIGGTIPTMIVILTGAGGFGLYASAIGVASVSEAIYTAVKPQQPNRSSLPDEELQKVGMYHNEAVLQLIENFNTSTDNLQEEMNRCIGLLSGLSDESKEQLIATLNEEEWWNQDPHERTNALINKLFENIQNSEFENKDALLKYAKECVDNVYDIRDLASFVDNNNQLLETASQEMGEGTELDILKSLVYVVNSTAELWLPESFGGTGVFGRFINSFDPNMNLFTRTGVPRWVTDGILRDGITLATEFSLFWWAMTTPQSLLIAAAGAGLDSVVAAIETYIEDKKPKKK